MTKILPKPEPMPSKPAVERTQRKNFCAELVKVSNSSHSDGDRDGIWCSITSTYYPATQIVAAHPFGSMHSQDGMDKIFGKTKSPELFSSYNAIVMCKKAARKFDDGELIIVPYVCDGDTPAEIRAWRSHDAKSYKIRIVNPGAVGMNQYITMDANSLRWKDLDGREVSFKSQVRPRPRYLFFHYICAMVHNSWHTNRARPLRDELGKLYWGLSGSFLPRNMLLALVKRMGDEYGLLLIGADNS